MTYQSKNINPFSMNWSILFFSLFFVTFLSAQETSISQHVEIRGAAGTLQSPQEIPTSGVHSLTLTAGQPVIGMSQSSNYSTDFGIWSLYLKEPDKPIVIASDGDAAHPKSIKIEFVQDVLSPTATGDVPVGNSFPEDTWKLTRDENFRANIPMTTESFSDDQSIFPGQYYDYGIKISNQFGVSDEGFDIGYTIANGKIAGRVFTPGESTGTPWTPVGNPVADVEVSLTPIRGKSLHFNGSSDYVEIPASYNDSISTAFSVEFWFNVDLSPTVATLFDFGDRLEIGHSNTDLIISSGTNSITTTIPASETWHHIAAVYGENILTVYLDGDSLNTSNITSLADGSDIRIGKNRSSVNYYKGFIDDIRVWNIAISQQDVQRNKNRALFGNEPGLVGYWKLDEGTSDVSFDMTDIKESAKIFGAVWHTDIPEIKLSDYTDENGEYEIRGIWYDASDDAGTDYTVTPYKANHNTFTEASEDVNLNRNNPQVDDVKFLDESMYTVSGYLTYDGTDCPVVNAEILLDSMSTRPETFTDDEGRFKLDFEPEAGGVITARFGGHFEYTEEDTSYVDGHLFFLGGTEQGYTVETISEDIAGVNFTDMHTESISGIIGGGVCLYDIGDVSVTIRSTPSCFERIDTVATGTEFELTDLPPLDYQITIEHENPDIEFENKTLSLRDGSLTGLEYMYRAPLQVEFTDLPGNSCDNGYNVVAQLQPDSVSIQVFELYDSQKCFLDEVHCKVNDDLSEMYYEGNAVLDEEGKIPVYFTAREPNILSGGDHPYQKKLEITVTDADGRMVTNSFWTYITGEKKSEANQFTTSTSKIPWFVLRNPPGDESFSYLSNEQSITTNFSFNEIDQDGNSSENTLHLGFDKTIMVGVGVALETAWSVDFDLGYGWEGTKTDVDIDETSFTFTRSETYATSGDEFVTGDDASVFVGGGLTMTFGIATNLTLDDTCGVQLDTTLVSGIDGFNSTYMFSKFYIKNHLMPNLYMKYQLEDDEQALEDWEYWDHLMEMDSTAIATARPHSAFKIGTQETASNIAFDAGVSFEYSVTTDSTFSSGTLVIVENSHQVFGTAGFTIDAFGFSTAYAHTFYNATEEENTQDTTRTRTIGFVLDDNDPGDAYTVDVLRDTYWGMPVFKILGGQSSNPWEENTLKRQWATMSIDPSTNVDIPPSEVAVFTLTLGNSSESTPGETWAYTLYMMNESNPDGAIVEVNGINLGGSGAEFEIDAGAAVEATMTVRRGPEAYRYPDIALGFSPPGELEVSGALGTTPLNSGYVDFSVYYIEPCSDINIATPSENWIINQDSNNEMIVTVNEFDTCATELQRFALEYAKAEENIWFIADTVSLDSVLSTGLSYARLTWNVESLDDGEYKIRARSICRLSEGTSNIVTGQIDRRSPQIVGVPEPVSTVLTPYDQISITLDEDIKCSAIVPSSGELYFALTGEPIATSLSCLDNMLILTPASSVSNKEIENQRLKAEVHFLKDLAGNTMEIDTVAWEFVVDRNPVHWNVDDLEQIVYIGEETVIPITLNNNGSANAPFEFDNLFDIPDYLTITPLYGDINPGGSVVIYIHIDPYLNNGEYVETIYAELPEGNEPLHLTINAMRKPPEWQIIPTHYQYSMSVTAELSVQNILSTDQYDRVGAFVGEECRGWAPLEHLVVENDTGLVTLDSYLSFLSIYSNVTEGETISFRFWDSSRGEELFEIEQQIDFVANSFHGTPSEPQHLNATGAIAQNFVFEAGWTWFSLNLDYPDMTFANIFSKLDATPGDRIVSMTGYAQYSETSGWTGPLSLQTLTNTSMYQAQLAEFDEFPYVGFIIDPDAVDIGIVLGWNWIGYTPQRNIDLGDALQNLESSTNDLIKSQFAYAQYDANFGWVGSLQWMEPDEGYMLQSAKTDTFTFPGAGYEPAKGSEPFLLAKNSNKSDISLPEAPWSLNVNQFRENMAVTAVIEADSLGEYDSGDVIAAFCGDELRGIARPVYIESMNKTRVFLMVYGQNGDAIDFKIWDSDEDITYRGKEHIIFSSNDILGSPTEPIALNKAALQIGEKGYVPESYSLGNNYPNPFNPVTKMGFGLPENASTSIKIYNLLGQEVMTLVDRDMTAGYHYILWNGKDNMGRQAPSGIYILVMNAEGNEQFRQVKKMTLLR